MIPVMQCPRLRLTVKSFNIIYERRKMKYPLYDLYALF